jgi:hydroxymethylglutaryl-CoA reductase
MMAVHLIVDVRDAMGANTVNTMAETVAPIIEKIKGRRGSSSYSVELCGSAHCPRHGVGHARSAEDR